MTKTITNKDVLNFTKAILNSYDPNEGTIKSVGFTAPFSIETYIEKVDKMLANLERKSVNKSKKSAETTKVNLEIAETLYGLMNDETTYAVSELLPKINSGKEGSEQLSSSKVSAVMKSGVENGLFKIIDEYKVGGKGRTVKGYVKIVD